MRTRDVHTRLVPMRFLRRIRNEEGIALVMALGMLIALTVVGSTALYYTTTNQRSANHSKAGGLSYSLAEAGIAQALSRLAAAADPTSTTLLTPTTVTLEGGTATYSGSLVGTTWTVTSTGALTNPAGVPPSEVKRTLTRSVEINGLGRGSLGAYWDRIYNHESVESEVLDRVTVLGRFANRGSLLLNTNTILRGPSVSIGGNVTMVSSGCIAVTTSCSAGPYTNIGRADITGTCQWNGGSINSPCTTANKVYATTVTTNAETVTPLQKPTINWLFWYRNAKPGPAQGCTTQSGTPPAFDTDYNAGNPAASYNKSNGVKNLTPGASYTCQVRNAQNEVIGELSWAKNPSNNNGVLTVKGNIFFDGDIEIRDDNAIVNYVGKAAIYASGEWHSDELMCAGGDGTRNCRSDMTNWDPTQNLLAFIVGGKEAPGEEVATWHRITAFQGILYATEKCKINETPVISGPVICTNFDFGSDGLTFYSWPALPPAEKGQLYVDGTQSDLQLIVGGQSG